MDTAFLHVLALITVSSHNKENVIMILAQARKLLLLPVKQEEEETEVTSNFSPIDVRRDDSSCFHSGSVYYHP